MQKFVQVFEFALICIQLDKNRNKKSIKEMESVLKSFEKLLWILNELREKCPWDRKQTFDSLRTLTIEEVYELSDAILERNWDSVKKELGDLLLHVVFYAKMADEKGLFNIKDVIDSLNEKLIYRHPHVFGGQKVEGEEQVLENWEKLKLKEKGGHKGVLDGLPKSLPAMIKAMRIQDKVSHVGFDWDKKEDVWQKVKEEISELEQELRSGKQDKMEEEFGDVLFVLINAARLYGINPETALERTNRKFISRFKYLEQKLKEQGKDITQVSLKEMDELWEQAKHLEKDESD